MGKKILKLILIAGIVLGLVNLTVNNSGKVRGNSDIIYSETFEDDDYGEWELRENTTNVESNVMNGYLEIEMTGPGYCYYKLEKNFTEFQCYIDTRFAISDLKGMAGIGCSFYNSTDQMVCGFIFYLMDDNAMLTGIGNFPSYKIGTLTTNEFKSIREEVENQNENYIPHILETGTTYNKTTLSYYKLYIFVQNFETSFTAKYDDILLAKVLNTPNAGGNYQIIAMGAMIIISIAYLKKRKP
jgi:hypothetical protein